MAGNQIIYDPGTGTIIGLDDVLIVELPEGCVELEEMEEFCEKLDDRHTYPEHSFELPCAEVDESDPDEE